MMKFVVFSTLCVLFLNGVLGYKLICVYTNWSQYRPDGGKFFPEDVDTSLCTHLIYVYAKLQGNKLAPVEWNDDGNAWRDGMYQRFNALKQYNPDLKTLLGVGGWNMGSKDFSRMASTPRSRRRFAKSAITFLRERNFDGLTIDWQHPTKRGGQRRDRVNFSLLLQELRRAFEEESRKTTQPTLLLSIGVSASRYIIDSAYEPQNISRYVDFMNVFAYDLHGPWDNYTGHPSPLYAREDELGPASEINVDTSMKYWISLGIDRSKLVLGISTYGRTFTLKEARYNGYGVPIAGPGAAGEFTREAGMIAYYERCSQYFDAPRTWDKHSKVAYWNSGDQWIAGEDVESVKHKVNWVRHNGIGGIMFSSLDMDDFSGLFCTGDYHPLLDAINKQFDLPLQPLELPYNTNSFPTLNVDIVPEKNNLVEYNFTETSVYNEYTNITNFDSVSMQVNMSEENSYKADNLTRNTTRVETGNLLIEATPLINGFPKLTANIETSTKPIYDTKASVSLNPKTKLSSFVKYEQQTVKEKQRNERLITELLNIFKANSMANFGTPIKMDQTRQTASLSLPSTQIRRRQKAEISVVPRTESTTNKNAFEVYPWNSFRMKPDVPGGTLSENIMKPKRFSMNT